MRDSGKQRCNCEVPVSCLLCLSPSSSFPLLTKKKKTPARREGQGGKLSSAEVSSQHYSCWNVFAERRRRPPTVPADQLVAGIWRKKKQLLPADSKGTAPFKTTPSRDATREVTSCGCSRRNRQHHHVTRDRSRRYRMEACLEITLIQIVPNQFPKEGLPNTSLLLAGC